MVLPQPDGPEQGEELAPRDVERDVVDGGDAAEALADSLDAEKGTLAAGGARRVSPGVLGRQGHERRARARPCRASFVPIPRP